MAAALLNTDAIILLKRPSTSDSFQNFTIFSASHGTLLVLQRLPRASRATPASSGSQLDLFDEASLMLESSNQGQTWFAKEVRVIERPSGIGKDYDALLHASAFTSLVARNTIPEESRPKVYALLRQSLAAFAGAPRPDIAYFKSLYCLARDEGYPIKQHWFPSLAVQERTTISGILNQPLAGQEVAPALVSRLRSLLENYLRAETEILID